MKKELLAKLSNAPKIKRTHCYVMQPHLYEIVCPCSKKHKITWSEFEKHIWCYDCKKDYIPYNTGIFSGPIPIGISEMLGISFDRINIETQEIMKSPMKHPEEKWKLFNKTWVDNKELFEYIKNNELER